MGLIREPKNVDFYVIDSPWTETEKEELSSYIKLQKGKIKKKKLSVPKVKEKQAI